MKWIPVAICTLLLAALSFAVAPPRAEADDFYTFYDAAAQHDLSQLHMANQHGGRYLPFLRIPSYAWMLRPLGGLPYAEARACWILILIAAFTGFLLLWPNQSPLLPIALAASVPVMFALQLGQDIALVMLIAAITVRLLMTRGHFAAGLIVSLAAIKLTFLAPLALIAIAQSASATAGLGTGLTAQIAISFAVGGLDWPRKYLALLESPGLDPHLDAIPGFRNLASLAPPETAVIVLIGIVVGYWFVWTAARRLRAADAMAIAMAVAVITAPHALAYDCAMLIPLFLGAASLRTWNGRLAALLLTPVPYLLLTSAWPASGAIASAMLISGIALTALRLFPQSASTGAALRPNPVY